MLNWVEINQTALTHNIKQFQNLIKQSAKSGFASAENEKRLCLVIKANAYGHGLTGVGKIIGKIDQKIWLGVNSVNEAEILRENGIKNPILILGYVLLDSLKKAIDLNVCLTVYNLETIRALGKLKKDSIVHLKIETGTGRQGVLLSEMAKFIEEVRKYPQIKLDGLSTHFANIEDTTNHDYAQKQLENFKKAVLLLEVAGFKNLIKHTACTAAAILFPETHFDMLRVGIGLYGLWPSKETFISAGQKDKKFILKPVLSWKTKVAQLKKLSKGSYISYGCTERLIKNSTVAILPVGYSDGYDRKLSSVGNVLIHGQRAKVLGRVCMNIIVVDVSHIKNIKIEDEAVLLGKQGKEEITAEEMAGEIRTINYEVVSRINPLLPRIYV